MTMTEKTSKASTPVADSLPENRDVSGRFQKGQSGNPSGWGGFSKGKSGNPGGRPKDADGIRDLARSYAAEAIETLVKIMRSAGGELDQVRAAIALLDRAHGKPAQAVNSTVTRIDPDTISDADLASYLTDAIEDNGTEAAPRRDPPPHRCDRACCAPP
jgi:hypothetical protein